MLETPHVRDQSDRPYDSDALNTVNMPPQGDGRLTRETDSSANTATSPYVRPSDVLGKLSLAHLNKGVENRHRDSRVGVAKVPQGSYADPREEPVVATGGGTPPVPPIDKTPRSGGSFEDPDDSGKKEPQNERRPQGGSDLGAFFRHSSNARPEAASTSIENMTPGQVPAVSIDYSLAQTPPDEVPTEGNVLTPSEITELEARRDAGDRQAEVPAVSPEDLARIRDKLQSIGESPTPTPDDLVLDPANTTDGYVEGLLRLLDDARARDVALTEQQRPTDAGFDGFTPRSEQVAPPMPTYQVSRDRDPDAPLTPEAQTLITPEQQAVRAAQKMRQERTDDSSAPRLDPAVLSGIADKLRGDNAVQQGNVAANNPDDPRG